MNLMNVRNHLYRNISQTERDIQNLFVGSITYKYKFYGGNFVPFKNGKKV